MAVARGDEPADLVLSGGHVLSVFTKEWLDVDVAVQHGHVVGLGKYDGRQTLDVAGAYLVPGFVDAHMHIESSKLMVDEFARAVLAHGTTAVVADPHEIANVLGTDGVHWLLDVCDGIPLDVWFMASSCVPASQFESPRRELTPGDLDALLRRRRVIGLAEMMNFPGVITRRSPSKKPWRSGASACGSSSARLRSPATCATSSRWSSNTAPTAVLSAPTTGSPTSSSSRATSTRWSASRSRRGSAPRTRS
ncbi:MAG: adenine deaminase [Chloroflexi bacterium]|nr:MAG: adenine deaminase [Chloroflexota bacterium]